MCDACQSPLEPPLSSSPCLPWRGRMVPGASGTPRRSSSRSPVDSCVIQTCGATRRMSARGPRIQSARAIAWTAIACRRARPSDCARATRPVSAVSAPGSRGHRPSSGGPTASCASSQGCAPRPREGEPTASFSEGDCDRDGCPNGLDPIPCDPCDAASCGDVTRDARPECSVETPDPLEPSARCVDAGPPPGTEDAGAEDPMDATGPPPPPATFGGSGCRCATWHSATPSRGLLALGLGVWLVGRSRARRRSRRAHADDARAGLGR